jgi:tetratricopeptide (TPR) repeat protein
MWIVKMLKALLKKIEKHPLLTTIVGGLVVAVVSGIGRWVSLAVYSAAPGVSPEEVQSVGEAAGETAPEVGQIAGETGLAMVVRSIKAIWQTIEQSPLLTGIVSGLSVAAIVWLVSRLLKRRKEHKAMGVNLEETGNTAHQDEKEPEVGCVSLDEALKAVVVEVEGKVEHAKVAVIPIEASSSALSEYLTKELYNRLGAKVRLSISAGDKDRARQAGLVTAADAVEAGRGQDADIAIAGEFSAELNRLYIRVFDIKKSEMIASYPTEICADDKTLRKLLGDKATATQNLEAPESAEKAALERIDHGKDLYAAGKTGEAIAAFTQALAANSVASEALFYRGNAHYRRGERDKAIADYTAALAIKPDYHEALYNRGVAYSDKGEYDAAIADYTAALAIKPDFLAALVNRGFAYDNKGEWDKAIADCHAALSINPDKYEALVNRSWAYIGKGEWDKAIADCDAALTIKPYLPVAFAYRGGAYIGKGEYDKAIMDCDAALSINPDYFEALGNRGLAYYSKGEYDAAITDYTAALAIKPDNAQIKENLAEARAAKAARDGGRRE